MLSVLSMQDRSSMAGPYSVSVSASAGTESSAEPSRRSCMRCSMRAESYVWRLPSSCRRE